MNTVDTIIRSMGQRQALGLNPMGSCLDKGPATTSIRLTNEGIKWPVNKEVAVIQTCFEVVDGNPPTLTRVHKEKRKKPKKMKVITKKRG